jgi:hypothetical protein
MELSIPWSIRKRERKHRLGIRGSAAMVSPMVGTAEDGFW